VCSEWQQAQRFAPAESAELCFVLGDVPPHRVGRGLAVLAQRPTDALAQEEVALAQARLDAREQQLLVRRGFMYAWVPAARTGSAPAPRAAPSRSRPTLDARGG
jgi:hypothetical protein